MNLKKGLIAGVAAFGLMLSGAGLSSVSAADYPGHNLKNGSHGNNVMMVQKQLSHQGFYLAKDSIFGPKTMDDVKDFQKMHRLATDGIVGPKTWHAMWNSSSHHKKSHMSKTLMMGSQGQAVKSLQMMLNKMGYHAGKADGMYGMMTKNAVMKYQGSHHLASDGIAGPKTMKAMRSGSSHHGKSQTSKKGSQGKQVKVDLNNGKKESVGTATLKQMANGVKVTLKGKNMPKGTHGFHIHEKGKCKAPDFKSAGDHFNPGNKKHGFDVAKGPHAGDMPNIVVDKDGTVNMSYLDKRVTLDKDKDNSLLDKGGTSIVIHKGKDDGKSQPSGDAGDRLACGEISQ